MRVHLQPYMHFFKNESAYVKKGINLPRIVRLFTHLFRKYVLTECCLLTRYCFGCRGYSSEHTETDVQALTACSRVSGGGVTDDREQSEQVRRKYWR